MRRALAMYLKQGQRAYLALPDLSETRPPSQVVERLDGLSEPALVAAWAVAPTQRSRQNICDYAQRWRTIRPTITAGPERSGLETWAILR
jgi:hypothetical protein